MKDTVLKILLIILFVAWFVGEIEQNVRIARLEKKVTLLSENLRLETEIRRAQEEVK